MTAIRVLIVDDSITVRGRLVEILGRDPDIVVVGEAGDGARAIELCTTLRPDVMTLDLELPERNGLEVTEHVMAHVPTPILIVSASFNRNAQLDTYAALAAGAVDVLDKDRAGDPAWEARFISAVRMASRIKVVTHVRARLGPLGRNHAATPDPAAPLPIGGAAREVDLCAVGASTGGPGALVAFAASLPRTFAAPIAIVLHIEDAFARAFAEWYGMQTRRPVRDAVDGERVDDLGPVIVLAPPGRHLLVEHHRLRISSAPPRNFCRPSVDVLFESMAADLGPRAAACLLTGMGRDGASGLLAIRRAGGITLAQDEATSIVWGMPREAIACGAAQHVLPLDDLGPALARLVTGRRPR